MGTITRKRITVNGTEESVLDYFIVCQELFTLLSSMKIDEDRSFVLSRYTKRNGNVSGGAIGLQQLPQSSTGLQTVTIRGGQAILTDGRGGQTILGDSRGGQTIMGDSRGGQAILGDIRSGHQAVVARQVTNSVQGIKSVVPSSVHKGE